MALQSSMNLFILTTLLIVGTFLSHSPRIHVEARTIQPRDVQPQTTTDPNDELTTLPPKSSTNDNSPLTTENVLKATESTVSTTTSDLLTEAPTVPLDSISTASTESFSYTPAQTNRSLYEELRATSSFPAFSFETSSEFMKFESMKMNSDSDELKSDESIDDKFKRDRLGFMNNATKEEHHTIDEALFDGETVKYSSIVMNKTEPEEEQETSEAPTVTTTLKKGKQLDLTTPEGGNMNASIPNAAEVWALAGMRKSVNNSDVEVFAGGLNNTAKNLLDWIEIAKMNNDSLMQTGDEKETIRQTTVMNDIDDPATSENKDAAVFITSKRPAATPKPTVEDNRIELENDDHGHIEFNKSSTVSSKINSDVFTSKAPEERAESVIELIDPLNKSDNDSTKERLRLNEAESKSNVLATTESPVRFTTDSSEMIETTTTEIYDTTTSIVDSFTVIGEDEIVDDLFKRTITEQPPATTDEPASTQAPRTATHSETTTEVTSQSANDIPEPTQRYNKSTKSIRATTTETPERMDTTLIDNETIFSTLIPKYTSSRQSIASTQQYEVHLDSSSSPTEIVDDDKFKYGTLLPDTTTMSSETIGAAKNAELEESTKKVVDALNKESLDGENPGSNNLGIISASVSVVVVLILVAVAYFVLKRRNQQKFSQRCRPVGLDAYSLDNVSVYNSVRRKANALRLSKRSYGNSAFEDPSLQSNVLDYQSLQTFTKNKTSIHDEFKEIPQVSVRVDEMPDNCEDKNRYANVVPLPETRVTLQRLNDEERSEYINANYVKGPKDSTNYYIATQAPLENTVPDFWRMIWEQNSKVIVMLTDLTENGVERCAEYIPASVVLDNSQTFGDFQVTLKSREVKGKYAVSQLHVKNLKTNTWREIMHLWYSWPENGCPTDDASIISLLLDARGYLKTNLPEQLDENSNAEISKDMNDQEKLSTLDKTKSLQRVQGPLTVHCSPGTGRTGTLIACDIILRMLETPPRQIDIPQIVYAVRRGRANAIRTKDQYEFIYTIANSYATKLNTAQADS